MSAALPRAEGTKKVCSIQCQLKRHQKMSFSTAWNERHPFTDKKKKKSGLKRKTDSSLKQYK